MLPTQNITIGEFFNLIYVNNKNPILTARSTPRRTNHQICAVVTAAMNILNTFERRVHTGYWKQIMWEMNEASGTTTSFNYGGQKSRPYD